MEPLLGLWLGSLLLSLISVGLWLLATLLQHRLLAVWLGRNKLRSFSLPSVESHGQQMQHQDSSSAVLGCHSASGAAAKDAECAGTLEPCKLSRKAEACEDVVINCNNPCQPMTICLEWQDISCVYTVKGIKKAVIAGIWGKAQPGGMQAIVGPSGAGKSTLMDILAMRKSVGSVTGRLLVNGRPASSDFGQHISYVPQEDTFIPTMTCRETLGFYAQVTLPGHPSRPQMLAKVSDVLAAVGLGGAANTMVGGTLPGGLSLRGLSGGERRRLSIAAGILSSPSVLFLDEPTSGLDSFAALNVVGHLQRAAQATQQTVVATIHQPRSDIWAMFDSVTVLSGGHMMYHGRREGLVPWFESIGYHMKPGACEPDWVLDLVATGFDKPLDSFGHSIRTSDDMLAAAAAFKKHSLQEVEQGIADIDGACRSSDQGNTSEGLEQSQEPVTGAQARVRSYPASPWRQFAALYMREMASITRNPADVVGRQFILTLVALIVGLIWYRPNVGSLEAMQATTNLLFASIIILLLISYIALTLFIDHKRIYLADISARLYRPSCYYLAKVLAVLPFHIFSVLTYCGVLYGLAGLKAGVQPFARFTCISVLVYMCALQVANLAAVVAPNYDTAFALSMVWTVPQLFCGSYFMRYPQMSLQWLSQLRWIIVSYFSLDALVQNELSGTTVDCSQGFASSMVSMLKEGLISATTLQQVVLDQMMQPQPKCRFSVDAFVSMLGYSNSFGLNLGYILAYLLVLHVLTYIALRIVARKDRR